MDNTNSNPLEGSEQWCAVEDCGGLKFVKPCIFREPGNTCLCWYSAKMFFCSDDKYPTCTEYKAAQ